MSDYSKTPDSSGLDLVKSALERREVKCVYDIAFNEGASRLEELGAQALPLIETVLRGCDPEMSENDLESAFPGIGDVFVTYFDVARAHALDRAASFLASLGSPLKVHALRAIWSIWIGRSDTGQIPDTLLGVIRSVVSANGTEASREARALLDAYSRFGHRVHQASAHKNLPTPS